MFDTRTGGMRMCIDKTWEDGFFAQIDLPAARTGQCQDLVVCAYRQKSAIADGYGLSSWSCGIDRPKIPIVKDEIRLRALQRHQGERPYSDKKIAPRSLEHV
jgi:hypothetical protein